MHKLLLTLVLCQAVWLLEIQDVGTQDSPGQATPPRINWIEDPKMAVAEAQRQGRPVLLYVTAEYCGYCRKMERESWSDATVIKTVSQHFVPLKLDGEKHARMVESLEIRGFPATIVFDRTGGQTKVIEGYVTRKDLLKILVQQSRRTESP